MYSNLRILASAKHANYRIICTSGATRAAAKRLFEKGGSLTQRRGDAEVRRGSATDAHSLVFLCASLHRCGSASNWVTSQTVSNQQDRAGHAPQPDLGLVQRNAAAICGIQSIGVISIVWQPNPAWIAASNLQRFMDRHAIASYDELHARARATSPGSGMPPSPTWASSSIEPYTQVLDLQRRRRVPALVRGWQAQHHPQLSG
jgi:hypothetical protein